MKDDKSFWVLVCLFTLLIVALGLMSCNKDIKQPTCHMYVLLSDKYTLQGVLIRHDTLSLPYSYACGKDYEAMRTYDKWFRDCEPIEHEFYIFDVYKQEQ